MASIPTNRFLDLLGQSHLLTVKQIAKLRTRIEAAGKPVDSLRVAKQLVSKDLITAWQARQLLAGRNRFYLGRYKLLDRLGKGGMGVVFRAQHAVMDRTVALKVMSPHLLKQSNAVSRFGREVKAAAALNHPNIITAFDADCVGSTHFLVMECVEGRDLNSWLRAKGPFPISAACECAMQTAAGLSHAARQGMVHRDIKPVNLLMTWDSEHGGPVVKILDMGLARFASETQEDGTLTRAGQMFGTPDYIAPEAAKSFKDADIRADIFSLGCALFKMLSGRLPFGGDTTMEKLMARAEGDAPSVASIRSSVPPGLDAVVAKMLARDVTQRYQTPAEVIEALQPFSASITKDPEGLAFFSNPLAPEGDATDKIEPDADTSLELFFRDFSISPLRDEGSAVDESLAVDDSPPENNDDLKFAPIEGEAVPVAKVTKFEATVVADPNEKKSKSESKKQNDPKPKNQSKPKVAAVVVSDDPFADESPAFDSGDVGDSDDFLDAEAGADGGDSLLETSKPRKPKVKISKKTRPTWESPLILIGGGSLLLVGVIVVVLLFVVGRQTGDEAFRLAEEDYQNGSYTQAIGKFTTYIEGYPGHNPTSISLAKVHRGLAQMRLAIDDSNDWPRNLTTTKQVLSEISSEEEFEQARNELAALLPRLSAGLAQAARDQQEESLIDQSREALDLVNKYVPSSLRQANQLEDIEATLALTRREIQRGASLKQALAEINSAIEAGETGQAYEVRRQLLKLYPDLVEDSSLNEAVLAISAAQQAAVGLQSEELPATKVEPPAALESTVALSRTVGNPAPSLSGQVFAALADGYAFGLDAETGALLWRRHVGLNVNSPPLVLPEGDCILLEDEGRVLSRIDRQGNPVWQHQTESPSSAQPLVVGDNVLLPTKDGLMVEIDLASGNSSKQITFPQKLEVAPTTDSSRQWLYQLGNHSNLYVVDANTGDCVEVVYLGHAAGSVQVAPVIAGQYLIVAENHALKSSRLRLLLTDQEGRNLEELQEIKLEGHVMTPPLVSGRSLHVSTDRGAWYTFDIGKPDQDNPLTQSVELAASNEEPLIRYPLVRGGDLWLAGQKLSHYEIRASQQRLVAEGVRYDDSIFLQPLTSQGDILLHVRRNANRPGIIAGAMRMNDATPLWETELSAPPATAPVVDQGTGAVSMLTTTGALYELPANAELPRSSTAKPKASTQIPQPVIAPTTAVILEDGTQVYPVDASGRKLLMRPPGEDKVALQWLTLPDAASGPIVAYQGGIIVPGSKGQVFVLDAKAGTELIQPFQPTLQAGENYRWRVAVSPSGEHLVLADQEKLYRVAVQQEPTAHLVPGSQIEIPEGIISSIAALDSSVFGITSNNRLIGWQMKDLGVGNSWDIGAGVLLDPVRSGSHVYVVDADNQLWCLDDQQQLLWKAPLKQGPPLGPPLESPQGLTIVTRTGAVITLDPKTGEQQSLVDLGLPISSGPVLWQDRLLVVGDDGALYTLSQP